MTKTTSTICRGCRRTIVQRENGRWADSTGDPFYCPSATSTGDHRPTVTSTPEPAAKPAPEVRESVLDQAQRVVHRDLSRIERSDNAAVILTGILGHSPTLGQVATLMRWADAYQEQAVELAVDSVLASTSLQTASLGAALGAAERRGAAKALDRIDLLDADGVLDYRAKIESGVYQP